MYSQTSVPRTRMGRTLWIRVSDYHQSSAVGRKYIKMTEYFLVKLTLWPIIFADLWQIDRWNFNTIRPAAMFLVWIVFTAAAKVINSRGKCILSVFNPVIPNTINKISFCFQQLRPISLVTVQSARPIVARVTNVRVYNQDR